MNHERWMNMTGATDATPNIPGDGVGSRLQRVDLLNITAVSHTTVTIDALVGLAVGQLLLTTDGFWATLTGFSGADAGATFLTDTSNTLTLNGHGIVDTTTVILREAAPGLGLPAPLLPNKIYFVVAAGANDLQLALTSGGAAIDITGTNRNVNLHVVSGVSALVLTVDKWRSKGGTGLALPALGTNVLSVFPAGSCLAGMQSARILRVIPTKSVTGVSANFLLDHRMATATPILPYASVIGVLTPFEFGGRTSAPFACQIGTVANFDCTVVFEVSS